MKNIDKNSMSYIINPIYYNKQRRKNNLTGSPIPTPKTFFLAAGGSEGMTPLNAFDNALMDAKVGNTNIIKMSSILPPSCRKIRPVKLPYGTLVPAAYASKTSSILGEMIASGVAVAIPKNPSLPGLIMEYSGSGYKKEVEEIVRNMAEEGMRHRGYEVKEILSKAIQRKVKKCAATFAAVVLWW